MDKKDFERVNKQLAKTSNAIADLNEANLVAGESIRKLEYELKLIEQKLADMEARDKKLDG